MVEAEHDSLFDDLSQRRSVAEDFIAGQVADDPAEVVIEAFILALRAATTGSGTREPRRSRSRSGICVHIPPPLLTSGQVQLGGAHLPRTRQPKRQPGHQLLTIRAAPSSKLHQLGPAQRQKSA